MNYQLNMAVERSQPGLNGARDVAAVHRRLTNVFTDAQERARAIGVWAGAAVLGIAIGPVTGGWLLEHFWWGSVFLVNLPIVVIVGMGLAMAPATDSIMGSLPRAKAGVGSAVKDTTRMVGGALGVAVLDSLLSAAYHATIADSAAIAKLPPAAAAAAHDSLGGAVHVAARLGSVGGQSLLDDVTRAFVDDYPREQTRVWWHRVGGRRGYRHLGLRPAEELRPERRGARGHVRLRQHPPQSCGQATRPYFVPSPAPSVVGHAPCELAVALGSALVDRSPLSLHSWWSVLSWRSLGSALSAVSAGSVFSLGSAASAGSVASIGSAGSILSIGSAGSILSIGSAGAILRVGRAGGPPRAAQAIGGCLAVAGMLAALADR
ncbi:MAG: MFS transporter [Acidimicrobiales bacterium]